MAEADGEGGEEARQRRGLKFRRRDDYAVELFREAQANLGDLYINAPIVDLATRRRVLELLERAEVSEASQILDERLTLYSQAPGTED